MDFCKQCSNMYYINVNEKNEVYNYCRNCGDSSELLNNQLMLDYDIDESSEFKIKNNVNQYTKYDPCLPNTNSIKCPDKDCKSNLDASTESKVIYIKYDNNSLKFLYLCYHCDKCWTN